MFFLNDVLSLYFRAEAVHVWQDGSSRNQAETHSAQAIIDGFSYISETISNVSSQPSKSISSWVADNFVNPSYWRANSEIICCKSCRINFERNGLKIHHCKLKTNTFTFVLLKSGFIENRSKLWRRVLFKLQS